MTIIRLIENRQVRITLTDAEMQRVYEEVKTKDILSFINEKLKHEHNEIYDNEVKKEAFISSFLSILIHYDSTEDEEIFNLVLEKIDSAFNCNNNLEATISDPDKNILR